MCYVQLLQLILCILLYSAVLHGILLLGCVYDIDIAAYNTDKYTMIIVIIIIMVFIYIDKG